MKIKLLITIIASLIITQKAFAGDEKPSTKENRSHIYIVGSSTVSPLTAAISEEFSRIQSEKKSPVATPVIKITGSGIGFKLFCSGVGYQYPDFVNASRPISFDEKKFCNHNKISNIIEIKIGYDGIVFGNFKQDEKIKFTKEQIFLALAEKIIDKKTGKLIKNPYENWNEIDASLPAKRIVVYGPPLTSGTRDIFADMVMESACLDQEEFVAAYKDEIQLKQQCHKIRNDGRFIDSGENDDLIVEHLKNNPSAFGILGFNFLIANQNIIQAVKIDGVYPDYKTIASKKYPLSRPLFIYFKKEHLKLVPKISEFIAEIINKETIGERGYLVNSGLVAMDKNELKIMQKNISSKLGK